MNEELRRIMDKLVRSCLFNDAVDHSCRAVYGMNCLYSLERWNRWFESHSRHGYLRVCLFCVCAVLCVGSGVVTG
jgi:hypothetical protein